MLARFSLANELEKILPSFGEQAPLYHYTDSTAVLGILQSQRFFATSLSMLNDSAELQFGLMHMQQWFDDQGDGAYANEVEIRSALGAARRGDEERELFVLCASNSRGSLSQFRAYGSYALEIKETEMRVALPGKAGKKNGKAREAISAEADWSAWRPVMYIDVEENMDEFNDAMDSLFSALDTIFSDGGDNDGFYFPPDELARDLITMVGAHMKHGSFFDEHEVRYLLRLPHLSRAIQLRSSRYGITPYVEIESASKHALTLGVTIGSGTIDVTAAAAGLTHAKELIGYPRSFYVEPLGLSER